MSEEDDAHKSQIEPAPLASRHVFLDTQVYRRFKHNPRSKVLALLADHLASRRLALHITDITLGEVRRQIADEVEAARLALGKAGRNVESWQQILPGLGPMPALGEETAAQLFFAFEKTVCEGWNAKVHEASRFAPGLIFSDYFEGRPPFDRAGSKEFPDSFVLHSLQSWCEMRQEQIYVITEDAAMLRFAEASPFLVPQTSIEALLASANASTAHDRDDEALVEAILNAPEFDHYYEEIVEAHAGELTLHYNGNLHNGEIIDRAFSGAIDNFDFQIVSRINERIGLHGATATGVARAQGAS